jgi:hypothetical protein
MNRRRGFGFSRTPLLRSPTLADRLPHEVVQANVALLHKLGFGRHDLLDQAALARGARRVRG